MRSTAHLGFQPTIPSLPFNYLEIHEQFDCWRHLMSDLPSTSLNDADVIHCWYIFFAGSNMGTVMATLEAKILER